MDEQELKDAEVVETKTETSESSEEAKSE